jgi:hypothetical protein
MNSMPLFVLGHFIVATQLANFLEQAMEIEIVIVHFREAIDRGTWTKEIPTIVLSPCRPSYLYRP